MMNRTNSLFFRKFRYNFSRFTAFTLVVVALGACNKVTYKEALHKFEQGYYGQAADMFETVSKKSKSKEEKQNAVFYAAESYRLNNDYDKAKRLYDKALAKDPKNTRALYMRANMLKKLQMYREALDAYDKYLDEVPGDSMAINKRIGCELALSWTPDSSRFVVENFKEANTKLNDWAPMIGAKKDNILYFASDREEGKSKKIYPGTMNYWSDIWYMEKKGRRGKEKWEKPVFLEKASTKYNEGAVTFDSRFSQMYMTQCGGPDGKSEKCAIIAMKRIGTAWEVGEPLEFCKEDTGHSYGHPAISPDGTRMYFSSDREGGYGGFDIWMVSYSKRSRTWSDPVNLGPTINTRNNEYFPYQNKHDNNLYFSSDGWPGIGGLDIFKAKPTEDVLIWKDLENLREPLNSGGDDFGITFYENDPNQGFFTSNRGDRRNNDDIYSFNIKPLIITLTGIVTDCNTKKPLVGATVIITNDKDTSKIVLKTDELASYRCTLREETNYEIIAKYPEEYYFDAQPVNRTTYGIKFSTELVQDFCLINPLDQLLTLPIFYDLDSARIRPDAAKILDKFANEVLIKYPKLSAELGSHTDCRASVAYNENLAQRRADSAVNYLVRTWKIDPKRILAKGYGEMQLVNDCKCEGAEVTGFTPYIEGKTNKMIVEKDARGNVINSYYRPYAQSEIKVIDGKKFVACDEFQHQQNRRTTVRFNREGLSSRVRVDENTDPNNRNVGGVTPPSDSAKKVDARPGVDLSYAVKVKISNGKVPATLNGSTTAEFAFDMTGRYTAVTAETAAEWFENKTINKASFLEGEKVKVGKVKLPSNKFVIDKMEIGGYEVANVQFQIIDKVDGPTLGKQFFRNFKPESFVEKEELVLIPKKAPRKKKEE